MNDFVPDEYERELVAAFDRTTLPARIAALSDVCARARALRRARAELIGLGLLGPLLRQAKRWREAKTGERRANAIYKSPKLRNLLAGYPPSPTMDAFINRLTSPTCVYLSIDIRKATRLRDPRRKVSALRECQRKAREKSCETAHLLAAQALKRHYARAGDVAGSSRMSKELRSIKRQFRDIRAKADRELVEFIRSKMRSNQQT